MQSNSTAPVSADKSAKVSNGCQTGKPEKPYPEFPLFPHATKRWAKKIRGQLVYFGPWDDPDGALQKYLDQKTDLHAGRKPRQDTEAVTVKDVVNAFLNHKDSQVESGELSTRTRHDYQETGDLLIAELGKRRLVSDLRPDDFAALRKKIAKRWGLHRIAKNIQYTRSIFKFAIESGLIEKPVLFGPGFARPSKKNFRLEKARQEVKLFTADEIHKLLKDSTPSMKPMILLGVNCGFGNADCATLPMRALDLEKGWINFPRPKTGLARRCPLWPETVQAIREWLEQRPTQAEETHVDLVFITAKGGSWMKETSDNPISKEMRKLMKTVKLNGSRNFYTLRHTHRTISDEVCDARASGYIMGHVDPSMASHYVEKIADDRLRRITDHIRAWLFAPANEKKNAPDGSQGERRPPLKIVTEEQLSA
jgi:integrase